MNRDLHMRERPREIFLICGRLISIGVHGNGKDNGMRRTGIVTAVTLGAALALVAPGIAYANTMSSVTVETPGATSWSAPGNGLKLSTDADCANSDIVSGGGMNVTGSGGGVMETTPSNNGSSESVNSAASPAHWLGIGGTGNNGVGTFTVQPFALCFNSSTITGTQVVVNSASGPTGTTLPSAMESVTATCPANTLLLGGGGESTLASNKSVKLIAGYPSYSSSGLAAADGDTNPDSWTAVALNGGMSGTGNTTYAYAICGNSTTPTVTVRRSSASGPTSGTKTVTTGTACGSGQNLIGGGASVSGGDPTASSFAAPGNQGDHLNGDYPSDSSDTLAPNGSTTTENWTAIAAAGGMGSSGDETDVWGLCI